MRPPTDRRGSIARVSSSHKTLRDDAGRYHWRPMSTPQLQVRRATIDDLPKLAPLWREENLDVNDLEKRFKEFQVVEGPGGEIIGALGLQIAGQEGRLHSEVF